MVALAPLVIALLGSLAVAIAATITSIFYASRRSRKSKPPIQEMESQSQRFPDDQEPPRKGPTTFTSQQLSDFTSKFSTKLGSGGFGVVYAGQLPDKTKIAVKILTKKAQEQFQAEAAAITAARHPNLVRLLGVSNDPASPALVYEYMENGSLDKYLFGSEGKRREIGIEMIEIGIIYKIAIGAGRGIAYLHEQSRPRIIHYDIKPGNILLDGEFSPRVADFGLARLCNLDDTHESVESYRGTPGYSAPEFLLNNYPITSKCDVYSFGMVLFEMVGRRRNAGFGSDGSVDFYPKRVWDEYERGELAKIGVGEGEIRGEDREKAERMCRVALWCVQDSPETRPLMSDAVKMLEGEMEILEPPKPFQYMYSVPYEKSYGTSSNVTTSNGGSSYIESQSILGC